VFRKFSRRTCSGESTEPATEPPEEIEDGAGEAGGTGVAEEAEKVWEGGEGAGDGGSLWVRTL